MANQAENPAPEVVAGATTSGTDYPAEKTATAATRPTPIAQAPVDIYAAANEDEYTHIVSKELNATEDDLVEARELAASLTLEETRVIMTRIFKMHEKDPNFPLTTIQRIEEFLSNPAIMENPIKHENIIEEMKLEAALVTGNSPYAEVRAVVDNHDDPSLPCSTIRSWTIGLFFSAVLAFINQLFSIRQPSIVVQSNVAQLLAFPIGKAWEKTMPNWGFTLWGTRHTLNPGRFNTKEHMLITIMANVAYRTPYTNYIIWSQYLPVYFNQSYAASFAYQLLIAASTNFIGYGMAGLVRRFLVYPSYCVWPASLVTIALNAAFHQDKNPEVSGPFRSLWRIHRLKFFFIAGGAMFIYFWLPNYLFAAMAYFSWITWISPNNLNLNTISGSNNGLGINPFPTFDWNILLWDETDPLMVPYFATLNKFLGALASGFIIVGLWYTNAYNTAYLPINTNRVYDHFAQLYNVSRAIDDRAIFDSEKYEQYSPPFLGAANIIIYLMFFGIYTAAMTYAWLYHRYEIGMGARDLWESMPWKKKKTAEEEAAAAAGAAGDRIRVIDVHSRLMKEYAEVPEWWYFICLLVSIAIGIAGIASWETYTTPAVVIYGVALCVIFVIPVGIIKAMTGVEVTLNVIAEFIGGSWVEGNALAMNFFKSYGYVTCAHTINFANDLKLAHYIKIPPRQTFAAQMVATLVSTLVCVGILNFQMGLKDVCTPDAPYRFTCPGINTFFTASVLWGTVGPKKMFGAGGQYVETLVGFPLGIVVVVFFYYLGKWFPKQNWIRNMHPVAMFYGTLVWAPYNLSYMWPAVPIAWFSWVYLKTRYLGFWSKYNFVLSAAFSCGIALSGILIFFALQYNSIELSWWGNDIVSQGCEGTACVRMHLEEGDYFGPRVGEFH